MTSAAPHHAGDPLLMLGFALFMGGWLIFSLRTGEVRLRNLGVVERGRSPAIFWGVCVFKLALALLGATLFILELRRK
jgi:hypothetical protein